MRLNFWNRGTDTNRTQEGAVARVLSPEQQLRRSIMACMLWEDTLYEEGQSVAERIAAAVEKVPFDKAAAIAISVTRSRRASG